MWIWICPTLFQGVCVAVAAMIQYFIMAAFCWMLIEGVYLYMFVVKVYNVSSKMKICHGVSWGRFTLYVAVWAFSNWAFSRFRVNSVLGVCYIWLKPGSDMPPRYLRQYCLQYYSKIVGYIASGNKKHRWPLPPARFAKSNWSQLRRHAGRKDWHGICCRRFLISYRNGVAGSTGSYIAGSSAAYENQA